MYIVEKFDYVSFTWHYMNSFKTYRKALDAMDALKRQIPGDYQIIERD